MQRSELESEQRTGSPGVDITMGIRKAWRSRIKSGMTVNSIKPHECHAELDSASPDFDTTLSETRAWRSYLCQGIRNVAFLRSCASEGRDDCCGVFVSRFFRMTVGAVNSQMSSVRCDIPHHSSGFR